MRTVQTKLIRCRFVDDLTDEEIKALWNVMNMDDWDWILYDEDDGPGSSAQFIEAMNTNYKIERHDDIDFRGKRRTIYIHYHA